MSTKAVSGMILTLLLICMLSLVFNIQPVKTKPTTIIVPDDYPTIQEAINNANGGDTIYVKAGTYYGNVVVNKSVMLVGEDRTSTIIDGNKVTHGIRIAANNVTITGFTVQNSGTDFSGIKILSSYNNIANNVVSRNHYGIILSNSSDTKISHNLVLNNRWGIYTKSSNNLITHNIILYNLDGIHLRSSYTTVAHNILSGNSFAIYSMMCTNNAIVSNEVSNSFWGIELVRSNRVMVVGNTVSKCTDFGIGLAYCSNNTVYHNNFVNNTGQVFIRQSYNDTWDNGAEGNYWSDYDDTDSNGDGIGDSPYVIDENNQDNYPLIVPYVPPAQVRVLYHELVEKYDDLVAVFNSLNSTYHELSDNYDVLLGNYSQLLDSYNSLNTAHQELTQNHSQLLERYGILNASYQEHVLDYSELQRNFTSLLTSYNNLQEQCNSLNSTLTSGQEAITNELNDIRNLMYIFIATTIIFIATAVYFAIIKPKIKP